jgi:hypothetical protein
MRQKSILVASLLSAVAFFAGAQAVVVSYVDGQVSQLASSSWKPVAAGDSLSSKASVRLTGTAYLELKSGSATLSLSQPGTYAIGDLLTAGRASRASKSQALVSKYLSAVSAKGSVNASTVAGVRGEEQGKGETEWVTSDSDVYLSAGKDYLASGDYASAKEQLAKALDLATSEKAEVDYYLAETEALSGNTRAAYQRLAALKPSGAESWAPDYVLLKARLLVDSFAPQAAIEVLTANQASLAGDSKRAPLYYFLLALAYKDSGDGAKQKASVEKLKSIAADSEFAKAVDELGN